MTSLWTKLWFVPESAVNLAAARIIFASHALWVLLSRDLSQMSGLPTFFWQQVPQSHLLRYLIFPGHPTMEFGLELLTVAALVCVITGFQARPMALVSGVLLYHLAPLETIFWTAAPYERGLTIDLLVLVTLAATPCNDALSLFRRRNSSDRGDYGWALRLIQFHLATVYLLAGVAKIRRVGPDWIDAENMRRWLLVFNQEEQVLVFNSLGPWIADHPILCWLMALGAMTIDLGFIFAVFWKRGRATIVAIAAMGHVGIMLAMNIFFINLPQLLVFVNWSAFSLRGGTTDLRGPTERPR